MTSCFFINHLPPRPLTIPLANFVYSKIHERIRNFRGIIGVKDITGVTVSGLTFGEICGDSGDTGGKFFTGIKETELSIFRGVRLFLINKIYSISFISSVQV